MTVNPLVAGRLDGPTDAWSGVWIAEDIELIAQGVRSGNWIDSSLGVVGAGLDALAMVSDPVGVLLQYGVAWIIEHVKPLSEALDWLAGDPGQIAGHAQTWRNVAASLHEQAADLDRAVRWDVSDWGGSAGPAYRNWSKQQQDAVTGLAKAAETMAAITEGAGALIAAVRILVRDAIATCVSRLITYAAEEAFSLGLATPLVVEQVSTLCASWAAKIARWLKGLLASLRRLIPEVHLLERIIEYIKKGLGWLKEHVSPGGTPKDPEEGPRGPKPGDADFDPGKHQGPLGDNFRPGVNDPTGMFEDKERAIADRLAQEGEMVHPRERVDDVQHLKNPDAMVRSGPDDPGVVTEFKTLNGNGSASVRRNILEAGDQSGANGVAVLDGRGVGLTEEDARRGFARAAGQARAHGQQMPSSVRIILGDDRIITLP